MAKEEIFQKALGLSEAIRRELVVRLIESLDNEDAKAEIGHAEVAALKQRLSKLGNRSDTPIGELEDRKQCDNA